MPTPNLYAHNGGYPESQVSVTVRDNRVEPFNVTDLAPETVDGS